MEPDQIYEFYTKMGISKLHKELCQAPIRIPDTTAYIVISGEMNCNIDLRMLGRNGRGIPLYRLMTQFGKKGKPVFIYTQPKHTMDLQWWGREDNLSPREIFIRDFWTYTGGDMITFEPVLSMIRTGDIPGAVRLYADLMGCSQQEASSAIEHLVEESKTTSKKKKAKK